MFLFPSAFWAMDLFTEYEYHPSWTAAQQWESSAARDTVMVHMANIGMVYCGWGVVPCEWLGSKK